MDCTKNLRLNCLCHFDERRMFGNWEILYIGLIPFKRERVLSLGNIGKRKFNLNLDIRWSIVIKL